MATVTIERSSAVTLHRVPYSYYVRLSNATENRHLRMTYCDGTLEIVSPHLHHHERSSRRISTVVTVVAETLGLPFEGTGSATFRRGGQGIFQGKGKEPDQSFYFSNIDRLPQDRNVDLDSGDPPPDLWIEVDHRGSSRSRLPIYVALRVPEVWNYRDKQKSLKFLQLVGSTYEGVDRSLSLPMLTPELVLEVLALGDGLPEFRWLPLLRDWIARTFPRPLS